MMRRNAETTRRAFLGKLARGTVAGLAVPLAGYPRLSLGAPPPANELRQIVAGPVISRLDASYEDWRTSIAWQPYRADIHGRYPELIVQAESDADVLSAVRFARKQGLKVAIKSGGHSESGAFLRDGGVLIDLGRLQKVNVHRGTGTFDAQPAVWSRNLAKTLAQHSLAFPVAHNATVTLGGYILAGGHGLNPDAWGIFACFNIMAADVVTADGELVHCNAEAYPDLYWAVRGAGPGFFGVVTRYYLKAYDFPNAIRSNSYVFPLDLLPDVLNWGQQTADGGIEKTELLLLLVSNPNANQNSPDGDRFLCIFEPTTFASDEQEARDILAPVAAHPMAQKSIFKQELTTRTFDELYQRTYFEGYGRHSSDTMWTNSPEKSADTLVRRFRQVTSSKSIITIAFRTDPTLPEDAAASVIGKCFIGCYSSWNSDRESARNIDWARQTIHSLRSISAGHYINEVNGFANPELVPECFSPKAWKRLQTLRQKYDPAGLFYRFPGLG